MATMKKVLTPEQEAQKEADKSAGRSYNWATIGYAESLKPDFKEILESLAVPVAISPLHDKDVNKDGTPKKPHYHILFHFTTLKSRAQVREITDRIASVGQENVQSLEGYALYLTHEGTDKAQYAREDVLCMGGFDIKKYWNKPLDDDTAFSRIIDLINEIMTDSYRVLVDTIKEKFPELLKGARRCVSAILAYMRSVSWEAKEKERKAKEEHDRKLAEAMHKAFQEKEERDRLAEGGFKPMPANTPSPFDVTPDGKQMTLADVLSRTMESWEVKRALKYLDKKGERPADC